MAHSSPPIHLTLRQFEMLVLIYLAQRLKVEISRLVALTKISDHEVTSCLGHLRGQQMITNTDRPIVARDRVRIKPSGADSGPEVVILPCIDGGIRVGREVVQTATNLANRLRPKCEALLAATSPDEKAVEDSPPPASEPAQPDVPSDELLAVLQPDCSEDEPPDCLSPDLVLELFAPQKPSLEGGSPGDVLRSLSRYDRTLEGVEMALTGAAVSIAQRRATIGVHLVAIREGMELLTQPFPIP